MSPPMRNMIFGQMSCAVDLVLIRRWGKSDALYWSYPKCAAYLARVDGAPAGTTLVYSQFGMGYVDHVATVPEHRRKGIASAMIARAVADSQAMGNRWTTLETTTGSNAERIYQRQGLRIAYHRRRYIMPHG